MDLELIPAGKNPPKDIYAVIEIPLGGIPVKYELAKPSGALFVDRFLHTAMFYPGNCGFIPHTLSPDGDPCHILFVSQVPVVPASIIRCRPVGALVMEDEAGRDEKILAVPIDALHPSYSGVRSYRDLPPIMCQQIAHFFQHYKDLEDLAALGSGNFQSRGPCMRQSMPIGDAIHVCSELDACQRICG